jgi:hypothetical protein
MGKPNGKAKALEDLFTPDEMKLVHEILDTIPELEEISISEIGIDYSYQDRKRERKQAEIATQLKPGLLGVLKISRRPDGSLWAVDGATRILGLRERGEKVRKLRCEVFPMAGPKVEAVMFAWWNSKRSHTPTALENNMQAAYIAGTDGGFGKAIKECGFDFLSSNKFRRLQGPGYVFKAWNLDGNGEVMKKSLYSCKDAWRDKFVCPGFMSYGVALFYWKTRPKRVDDQLRRLLHRKTPDEIMDAVTKEYLKAGGKGHIHPDHKPPLIAAWLAKEINKNPGSAGKIDMTKFREKDEDRVGA